MYTIKKLSEILICKNLILTKAAVEIEFFITDSRNIEFTHHSAFIALKGGLHNGHAFIGDVISKGVKNIIAEYWPENLSQLGLNILLVENCLEALQKIAAFHRNQFSTLPVIGITGSNGKTIVKEWLAELLIDRNVIKSPKSYNSQLGVPLSVLQIRPNHDMAIFEAGLSQPAEMVNLEKIIRPKIGILTNIGDAHAGGFENIESKLEEKLLLFKDAETIIFEEDNTLISRQIRKKYSDRNLLSWGKSEHATLFKIIDVSGYLFQTTILIQFQQKEIILEVPFSDDASLQNICHCVALMLYLDYDPVVIADGIRKLHNLPMRMEMKDGIRGSVLINDSYNADLLSLKIALEFLVQQAGNKERMLIISDFFQTGLTEKELNSKLAQLIQNGNITEVIGVGKHIAGLEPYLDPYILFKSFETTEGLIKSIHSIRVDNRIILIKGSRLYELEKLVEVLSAKRHSAVLEIDMQALANNLRHFSELLSGQTKIIAVIKASAYGSGSIELAKFLEFKKIHYLAVAFTDEGVELRKAGITLPIMILNPDLAGIGDMVHYILEPEVYSLQQLNEITTYIDFHNVSGFGIHLKFDTGMHRLGFMDQEINELSNLLKRNSKIQVKSVFSHLSSSEDPEDDNFSHQQAKQFSEMYLKLTQVLGYKPPRHLVNSAGIVRFPAYHFEMVRLGLGMYGIGISDNQAGNFEKVHCLKAQVIQIKHLPEGASVGYNRKERLVKSTDIAISNIGYADGLLRYSGNRNYNVQIKGKDYPIIGNVCMDLIIIEIGTNHDIQIGDEVVIFGKDKPIEQLAAINHTIPYEILSRISQRIKRIFVQN